MLKKLSRAVGVIVLLSVFLGGFIASAQNRAIRGTVVDGTGAPAIGATVVVVGNTSIGAVTDANGSFRLNVPSGSSLEVSCIGYASQVVPVGDRTEFAFVDGDFYKIIFNSKKFLSFSKQKSNCN